MMLVFVLVLLLEGGDFHAIFSACKSVVEYNTDSVSSIGIGAGGWTCKVDASVVV